VDSTGKIYLTGQTGTSDFPTNGTIAALKPGPNTGNLGTSFITKLDPAQNGTAGLVYSSYLGGTSSGDIGEAIAVAATETLM